MRRSASVILLLTFLALGSGLTQRLHEWQHAQQDAAAARSSFPGKPPQHHPIHDDLNCHIHAQLHMPIQVVAWLPPTIQIETIAIATVSPDQAAVPQNGPERTDCRGPPAC